MTKYDVIDNFYRLGMDYELMRHHKAAYVWKRFGYTKKQMDKQRQAPLVVPVYHDQRSGRMWLPWDGTRYWLPDICVQKSD